MFDSSAIPMFESLEAREFLSATPAAVANQSENTERSVGFAPAIGDANGDGKIDLLDLQVLETNYGKTSGAWSMGDFNNDGNIDFQDYLLLENHFDTWPTTDADPVSPAVLAALKQAIRDGTFELRVNYDHWSGTGVDLHALGIPRINMLWWEGVVKDGWPDDAAMRRYLSTFTPEEQADDIQLDLEWQLSYCSPEVRAESTAKYLAAIAMARRVAPDAQLSLWGVPYVPRDLAQAPDICNSWKDGGQLATFDPIASQVDVIAPELYTRFADYRTWNEYATAGVRAMQERWNKPIAPVLYGQLWDTYDTPNGHMWLTDHWISGNYLLQQIATTYQLGCAGATVFCEASWNGRSIPFWPQLVSLFQ